MEIIHQKEDMRFVLPLENKLEAFVQYEESGKNLKLIYSEVPNEMRGKGVGRELVLKTFEKLTSEGYEAVAICSYIRAVAQRHPEWREVIK